MSARANYLVRTQDLGENCHVESIACQSTGERGGRGKCKERTGTHDAPAESQAIANAGIQGAHGALPYSSQIQALFGRHDIRGIAAHVGDAAVAADALGARAYATGADVAFADAPDLHTAAHEAAHVVQQRSGVSLSSNMGAAGDPYERHADEVADRVVAGLSAQDLLDAGPPSANANPMIQRRELPDPTALSSPTDWHVGDRHRLSGTFESANLRNLADKNPGEYTRIEERRDFYRWFYNYTSALGCTTRWALAASLVANGAYRSRIWGLRWKASRSFWGR